MQRILIGALIKEYKAIILECKQLENYIVGDKWTLSELKVISTE